MDHESLENIITIIEYNFSRFSNTYMQFHISEVTAGCLKYTEKILVTIEIQGRFLKEPQKRIIHV